MKGAERNRAYTLRRVCMQRGRASDRRIKADPAPFPEAAGLHLWYRAQLLDLKQSALMPSPTILVDADACPVKPEIYKVAGRYGLRVVLVANQPMRLPTECAAELVVVGSGFDAADDHIAETADTASVVVTADIPLADRCLKKGAIVIGPTGRPFTPDSIGAALASRALMADLREMARTEDGLAGIGRSNGLSPRDRSQFLQTLDQAIQALKQGRAPRWR